MAGQTSPFISKKQITYHLFNITDYFAVSYTVFVLKKILKVITMKSLGCDLNRWLKENREDFLYLLIAGAPMGILCAFLSQYLCCGELN